MLPAQLPRGLNAASALEPSRPGEAFGIIAGGGLLPRLLADAAARSGWRPVIVTIADGIRDDWAGYASTPFRWGRTGDIFPHLRRHGIEHVAFCGTISVRPDYRSVVPSLKTLALLPQILRIVRGGDDSLLRSVARAFEERGFHLHAVQELLPELLTPAGLLTRSAPGPDDLRAIDRASAAARWLGEADIGQAAVASAERVIAREGIEGTREMLARVADLRQRGRLARTERCVLVKGVKPQQDLRFDLPSVGAETVAQAKAAGIVGIGLTAGASLLIGIDEILAEAASAGMFVLGLEGSAP